jgi:hypothetical protein
VKEKKYFLQTKLIQREHTQKKKKKKKKWKKKKYGLATLSESEG